MKMRVRKRERREQREWRESGGARVEENRMIKRQRWKEEKKVEKSKREWATYEEEEEKEKYVFVCVGGG